MEMKIKIFGGSWSNSIKYSQAKTITIPIGESSRKYPISVSFLIILK